MTDTWDKDTGLVFALFFLLVGILKGHVWALWVSTALLLLVLFIPLALKPLAVFWFSVAEHLGFIMNKVFFGLVFMLIVVPVGLLKRASSGDARSMKKQPTVHSAFKERTKKLVEAIDIQHPF